MANRAEIARMCSPYWLIDTDNDLMVNKNMWKEYIRMQPLLGIPDTYYISAIASSGEIFDQEDYDLLKSIWKEYREKLYKTDF